VTVAQVAQPVEPNARREAPVQLGLGRGIGRRSASLGNAARERSVVERGERGVLGHMRSIAFLFEDV
jgi:hypothetical protein